MSIALAGCGTTVPAGGLTPTTESTSAPTAPPAPVVVKISLGRAPATLDPLLVGPPDVTANDLIENLFAGLARLDGDTGMVEPLLAKSWETSSDGLTWRVALRDDIFWVRINPDTSQMEKVRPITASDVVYTVQRACRTPVSKAPMLRAVFLIKGCGEINQTDPAKLTDAAVEQTVGVRALNDVTVEFALAQKAAYFPTALAMPVLRPLPADLIDKEKDGWTLPDKLWTSGPYTVQPTSAPDQGYTLVANTFWPMPKTGNVDGVQVAFDDVVKAYGAWQAGDLALATIPPAELTRAPFDRDARYRLIAVPRTMALVASYDTPPLDQAEVRRALSLAVDRQAIVQKVMLPSGEADIPAVEFAPPGSAGAPAYGSVGQAGDEKAAKEALAAAGFDGCKGLPQIKLLIDDSPLSKLVGDELIRQWTETLGCPDGVFALEIEDLNSLVAILNAPPEPRAARRAGLTLLYWQADTLDAYHWLADILGCREKFPDAYLNQSRPCSQADEKIAEAASTADEQARSALYRDVEQAWFGAGGEMPVIPLTFLTRAVAVQPWLAVAPIKAGPLRFDAWVVDTSKKP